LEEPFEDYIQHDFEDLNYGGALVCPFCFLGTEQAGCAPHAIFFGEIQGAASLCAVERFVPNDHIRQPTLLDVHAAPREELVPYECLLLLSCFSSIQVDFSVGMLTV
jgi:hypothetical protein